MISEERTSTQHRLMINLGKTLADRLKYVQQIKNAMAYAIMLQVENDSIDKKDERFQVFQLLYLEADYLEGILKEQ